VFCCQVGVSIVVLGDSLYVFHYHNFTTTLALAYKIHIRIQESMNRVLSESLCKSLYYRHAKHNKIPPLHVTLRSTNGRLTTPFPAWVTHSERAGRTLVCKVDQAVKQRAGCGLVILNATPQQVIAFIKSNQEYSTFILEQMQQVKREFYVCIQMQSPNDRFIFSATGGTDFHGDESECTTALLHRDMATSDILWNKMKQMTAQLALPDSDKCALTLELVTAYTFFIEYRMSTLEINPLVITTSGDILPIDFAVTVNDGNFTHLEPSIRDSMCRDLQQPGKTLGMVDEWVVSCTPAQQIQIRESERVISTLNVSSGASFQFEVLNPNGCVWTIIAGGGASMLYTDAITSNGYGGELGNYGEYSGNPSVVDTAKYVENVIAVMLHTNTTKPLCLIIGGGVSNFTCVKSTFLGIQAGIAKHAYALKSRDIRVFVRRGGINATLALASFDKFLTSHKIEHEVHDHSVHITTSALDWIKRMQMHTDCHQPTTTIQAGVPPIVSEHVTMATDPFNYVQVTGRSRTVTRNTLTLLASGNHNTLVIGANPSFIQRIVDFDQILSVGRTKLCAIVDPCSTKHSLLVSAGDKHILIPIFKSVRAACQVFPEINVVINNSSGRSVYDTTVTAIEQPNVKIVTILAEGLDDFRARELRDIALRHHKFVLGPSSVGLVVGGVCRLGTAAGCLRNIYNFNLHNPTGTVSVITRSGGLLNEMCNIVSASGKGVRMGVAIGGDRFPCSTFLDIAMMLELDEQTEFICMLGELGGVLELQIAQAIKDGDITKPIICWVMGGSHDSFVRDVHFGHAGSFQSSTAERAHDKMRVLRSCGVHVPASFELFHRMLMDISKRDDCSTDSVWSDEEKMMGNEAILKLIDLNEHRKKTSFYSSVSCETGAELSYNNMPLARIMDDGAGYIGRVIGHLVFKEAFPPAVAEFIDVCVAVLADHGVAVSSAHNTAVCTRSGQNMSAAVASGILCIHTKHGGAIQDAADAFFTAFYEQNLTAEEFVVNMKTRGMNIPGIGHLFHNNTDKRDDRIAILSAYKEKLGVNGLVAYATEVERITTNKKANLILNVDGLAAVMLVEALVKAYGKQRVKEFVLTGAFRSIFIISRTIGLCATHVDQIRLDQGLFRYPLDDITYISA
jgi:ATP citrate (pro-S)-lyase